MSSNSPLPSFHWPGRTGTRPEQATPAGHPGRVVDCAVYVDGRRLSDECSYKNALAEVRERRDGFVWLGLLEPGKELMTDVAETFGLHQLAVEDAVQAHQRPTLPLPKEIRRYLRDVTDHHTAVTEQIIDFNESLSALINAALAKVSVQQNTDMRKISAYAAMAAVPTMIAGVYGMNFQHMPELSWTYGYPIVIAIMLALCGLLYANFHRNNWL